MCLTLTAYTSELGRLEKERKIRPSAEIDAFMKVTIINASVKIMIRAFTVYYGLSDVKFD